LNLQINPTPYEAGFHFLGIGHTFLIYPKSVVTFEFSGSSDADIGPLESRTLDGLSVIVEVSF